MILEGEPGGRISCIMRSESSSEVVAPGHPTSARHERLGLASKHRGYYLIYHIDEGLGIVSRKVPNRFNFVAVGKNVRDQRDPIFQSGRMVNQALPCRRAAVHENKSA